MIEIITEEVEMPDIYQRRYQKECKNFETRKEVWLVIDTETNTVRYKGKFEEACLACYNLNKNHYRNITTEKYVG